LAVKAVVLDLDGTLIDASGQPVTGVPEMLDALRGMGLGIAVASNQTRAFEKLSRAGLRADLIIDRGLTGGVKKGSPVWVTKALEAFEIQGNEIVWLGDSNLDMRSAVNARILYFNAGWSQPNYPYGINLSAPALLPLYLSEFFVKPVSWYWEFNGTDGQGQRVIAKAMMDTRGAGISALQNDLVGVLKGSRNPRIGPMMLRDFVFLHFVGSLFGDSFYHEIDTWTAYPSSRRGVNPALGTLVNLAAKLFRERYVEDLLVRHTVATDSGEARLRQEPVDFSNQSNTMQLNPEHRQRIRGQFVVVIDDFTTDGYSGECARLLLLKAGAAKVACINIGKYGRYNSVISLTPNHAWDPYEPTEHPANAFREISTYGQTDQAALTVIRDSYERVGRWRR
jgi:Haloacid dehalogenase-like hydrolase